MVQSLRRSKSFRILFNSPELVEEQRSSFHHFLKHGIAEELSKISFLEVKRQNVDIEVFLDATTFQLIAPDENSRNCIIKMKTYACKLYVQIRIVWKKKSGEILMQTEPEWVLLAHLPMMTKRGHFIINGSPRVIVHQVVRAPGVYFQKFRKVKKDERNKARFYGDIIPRKGVWVRLQISKTGQVEIKLKKSTKVQAEMVERCLAVIEKQELSKRRTPQVEFLSDLGSSKTSPWSTSLPERSSGYSLREFNEEQPKSKNYAQLLRANENVVPATSKFKRFYAGTEFRLVAKRLQNRTEVDQGPSSIRHNVLRKTLDCSAKLSKQDQVHQSSAWVYRAFRLLLGCFGNSTEPASFDYKSTQPFSRVGFVGSQKLRFVSRGAYTLSACSAPLSKRSHSFFGRVRSRNVVPGSKSFAHSSEKRVRPTVPTGTTFRQPQNLSKQPKQISEIAKRLTGTSFQRSTRSRYQAMTITSISKGLVGTKFRLVASQLQTQPTITDVKRSHEDLPSFEVAKRLTGTPFRQNRTFVVRARPIAVEKVRSRLLSGAEQATSKDLADKFARAELKGDDRAFTNVYDNLYRVPEMKELEDKMYPKGCSTSIDTEFKRDFSYKHIFATFKAPWRYSLGEVGRHKLNKKFGLDLTDKQLTSLDVQAARNWLYRLRDGKEIIDDIDHSQNRRVRQSGELIQNQFENGVTRLRKLVRRKLKTPTFESLPFGKSNVEVSRQANFGLLSQAEQSNQNLEGELTTGVCSAKLSNRPVHRLKGLPSQDRSINRINDRLVDFGKTDVPSKPESARTNQPPAQPGLVNDATRLSEASLQSRPSVRFAPETNGFVKLTRTVGFNQPELRSDNKLRALVLRTSEASRGQPELRSGIPLPAAEINRVTGSRPLNKNKALVQASLELALTSRPYLTKSLKGVVASPQHFDGFGTQERRSHQFDLKSRSDQSELCSGKEAQAQNVVSVRRFATSSLLREHFEPSKESSFFSRTNLWKIRESLCFFSLDKPKEIPQWQLHLNAKRTPFCSFIPRLLLTDRRGLLSKVWARNLTNLRVNRAEPIKTNLRFSNGAALSTKGQLWNAPSVSSDQATSTVAEQPKKFFILCSIERSLNKIESLADLRSITKPARTSLLRLVNGVVPSVLGPTVPDANRTGSRPLSGLITQQGSEVAKQLTRTPFRQASHESSIALLSEAEQPICFRMVLRSNQNLKKLKDSLSERSSGYSLREFGAQETGTEFRLPPSGLSPRFAEGEPVLSPFGAKQELRALVLRTSEAIREQMKLRSGYQSKIGSAELLLPGTMFPLHGPEGPKASTLLELVGGKSGLLNSHKAKVVGGRGLKTPPLGLSKANDSRNGVPVSCSATSKNVSVSNKTASRPTALTKPISLKQNFGSGNRTFKQASELFSTKPINGALREFFGSNPLSQYMDQTNPLAEVTHKRRISSLGIGGVSRESAGMAIRGIHPTHYGRICPIETPEGKNAGLVNSLALYAKINKHGFIETPYYKVIKGQVQEELGFSFYSALKETVDRLHLAPSDLQQSQGNMLGVLDQIVYQPNPRLRPVGFSESLPTKATSADAALNLAAPFGQADLGRNVVPVSRFATSSLVPVRVADTLLDVFKKVSPYEVDCIGISPVQILSVATSLIPFLEHNDANRALMGSNMQRQAVPLMISERPIVGTGLETLIAAESGQLIQSRISGVVSHVSANKIVIERLFNTPSKEYSAGLSTLLTRTLRAAQQPTGLRSVTSVVPTAQAGDDAQSIAHSIISRPTGRSAGQEARVKLPELHSGNPRVALALSATRLAPGTPFRLPIEDWFRSRSVVPDSKSSAHSSFGRLSKRSSGSPRRGLRPERVNRNSVSTISLRAHKIFDSVLSPFLALAPYGGNQNSVPVTKPAAGACSAKLSKRPVLGLTGFGGNSEVAERVTGTPFRQAKLTKSKILRSFACRPHSSEGRVRARTALAAGFAFVKPARSSNRFTETSQQMTLLPFIHSLRSFSRSNQETCLTQKPLVVEGEWVQKGEILTDCSASEKGELAVGKNVLIAYLPWEGYNFEDAIVVSDRLTKEQIYASLHIERYVCEAQDIKEKITNSNEWFTRHLPGVHPKLVSHLDTFGFPKIGTILKEGDILVGKMRYFRNKPTTPYEKLLSDILGDGHFSVSLTSLRVPKGVHEARVISHRVVKTFRNSLETTFTGVSRPAGTPKIVHIFLGEKRSIQIGDKMSGRHGNKGIISTILPKQDMPYLPDGAPIDILLNPLGVPSRMNVGQIFESLLGLASTYLNQNFKITAFDELYGVEASQSLVYLKLYQARLQSGQNWLFQVNFPGKTRLIDGRSGECFDQWVTVGRAYMLKLIHMVNEKIHARNTGPYALITQQPLRGRSQKGGQRLGEMEVWALEGYGAAYILQELLTKKSDDFAGRQEIINSLVVRSDKFSSPDNPYRDYSNPDDPYQRFSDPDNPYQVIQETRLVLGHPEIFKTLICELQALCLDVGVYALKKESFQREYLGIVN